MPIGRIQLKHGLEASADFNSMLQAEAYYATDTERLMISNGDGTGLLLPSKPELDTIQDDVDTLANNLNLVDNTVTAHLAENAIDAHNTIPSSKVVKSAAQSISSGTMTTLSFNVEIFDTDNMHDNSVNNSRLTANTAGKYLVIGYVGFQSHATGRRLASIWMNGSEVSTISQEAVDNGGTYMFLSALLELNENDYVELKGLQDSGVALSVAESIQLTSFSMVKVG